MDQSRIAVIVLVLIAVLFAIGVGAGIGQGEEGPDVEKMDSDQIKAFVEKSVPDFFKNLRALLGSRGAKLKAQDFSSPKLAGPAVFLDFSEKEPLTAVIGKSEDENRTAVFKLASGGKAAITYEPKSLPAGVEDPKAKAELRGKKLEIAQAGDAQSGCGKNDRSCAEISIFKDGGNLTFECLGDQPCRVELR